MRSKKMRFIELAETAKQRLLERDQTFQDKSERLVGLMRALDIVPTKRASLNGHWHMLLGAMIVTAFDEKTTLDISTRRKGNLSDAGLTTNMMKWLDKLVKNKMLIPANGASKALGALLLSDHLIEQIE